MNHTKVIIFLLAIAGLINVTSAQTTQNCDCEDSDEMVLFYTDSDNQILVCGTKTDGDSLVYELTMYDCLQQTFLIDNRYDEIFPNSIQLTGKGFMVTDYHFAPVGDNWKQTILPFVETEYVFENAILKKAEKIIFDYPELTANQINDIKELCDQLYAHKNTGKEYYPFDNETIYILFIGAYKNVYSARQLFFDLTNLFELDGAAAETMSEIAMDRLIE